MIYVFVLWRSLLFGTQTIPALSKIKADSLFVQILQSKAQAEVNKQMATVDSVLTAKFGAQYTIDNILKNMDEIMNSIPEGTGKRWFGEGRKTRKSRGKRNRKTYRRQK
jgi:hypothetical protein